MAISNASNQIVKVNLIPGIIPSVLHLSQYDTGAGRPITFSVYDGSQAFTIPSGVSIAFEGTKSDGKGFSFTCSKSGSNALLTNYTNQMTALSGKIMCQLVFTDTSGGRVGSLPVLMVVTPAGINGDTVISDSDIEAIIAAQNAYAVLNARLDAAISAATQDSEVQDIRVKANGKTAASAGNAVREQITELKNKLDDTNNELGLHSGNVVTNAASSIIVRESFSVKQGESVTVKCSYTGSNTTKYDLRFYASGTLHIIKTSIPFDEGYTFIAERDYDEIAIYSGLSQPYTAGNIFSWSGYISTGSIFKTNALEKDAAFYDSVIIDKTKVDKTNYYKNRSLMIGRVYKGVYDSGVTTIKCTDYIQIIPQHKYAVYGGFLSAEHLYYFNRNKEIVATLPYENLITAYPYTQSSNHMIFTAPDDAGYIRINFLASNVSENIVPDGFYFVDITNDSLANIKVLVIGDSISADYYGGYPKWVTDLISEGYFLHPNVKNDSIHATGFVARYSSTDDDTFLTRIRTYNQNDYDWVVLFGGINDFIQSIDYDAFKAAVDAFFQYMTANFYNKKICVFSPLRTSMTAPNNAGHIQQDYQDYIKAVAKNYAIPVLNLTEESGFYPFVEAFKNQWTLLPEGQTQHDGVHPTEAWEKQFLVPIVKDFFRRFYE